MASTVIALDAGDASFGYTDFLDGFPSNPDTTVSVVNPNGLSVAITDEPDGATGEGLNVAVGAGSGSAQLMACGLPTYPVAGSTVVITCASLILRVVVGSAEVVLGAGLTVSVPQGGKAEIAERPDGNFTVENQGSQPIGVTIDGVAHEIAPGGTATVGLPGEMIADLVDKTPIWTAGARASAQGAAPGGCGGARRQKAEGGVPDHERLHRRRQGGSLLGVYLRREGGADCRREGDPRRHRLLSD